MVYLKADFQSKTIGDLLTRLKALNETLTRMTFYQRSGDSMSLEIEADGVSVHFSDDGVVEQLGDGEEANAAN